MGAYIDTASNIIAFAALIIGTWWGIVKFMRRDEHFPRVMLEVSANFVGIQNNKVLFEVLAYIENNCNWYANLVFQLFILCVLLSL